MAQGTRNCTRNSDKAHRVTTNLLNKDSDSLTFFHLDKIMDREKMILLTKSYQTLNQSNQLIIYVSNPQMNLSHQFRMEIR